MKRLKPLFYTVTLAGVVLCESAVLAPASALVVSPFLIPPQVVSCTGTIATSMAGSVCNITCASARSQLRTLCHDDDSGLSAEQCAYIGSGWTYNQATSQCIPPTVSVSPSP
jgi:hypothetical protein